MQTLATGLSVSTNADANCSLKRNDGDLGKYLLSNPSVINVHEDCRRQYLYVGVEEFKRPIDELDIQTSKNKFLRTSGSFDFSVSCVARLQP